MLLFFFTRFRFPGFSPGRTFLFYQTLCHPSRGSLTWSKMADSPGTGGRFPAKKACADSDKTLLLLPGNSPH